MHVNIMRIENKIKIYNNNNEQLLIKQSLYEFCEY
jgi:hypothetical protein